MLRLSFQASNPRLEWEMNQRKREGLWADGTIRILRLSWYLDPAGQPAGLYAAFDFRGDRPDKTMDCGYVVVHRATTVAGWTTTNGSNVSGGHSGRWSWQLSGAASAEQKLNSLPNGTYTLSVWVKGGAGTLYAKGFGGTDKSAAIASTTAFTKVTLSGIAVSNGTCQIGASTTSGTLSVDDFSLAAN
jgi:hypothetical protein